MKKLFVTLLLCFCMVTNLSAQVNDFGQTSAKLAISGGDTSAQSFYFPGGFLEKFRLVVFSRYSTEDHPGTLTILQGDGLYGNVIYQESVMVGGLNRLFPNIDSMAITSNSSLENLWVTTQNLIDGDVWDFEGLATDFQIGNYFQSGEYTVMVSLDTTIVNQFGYRWITTFSNCYSWPCASPYNVNPYVDGKHYQGLPMDNPDRDMAFEVVYQNRLSTDVEESTIKPEFVIQNGRLVAPANGRLEVFDSLGRRIHGESVYSGEGVTLPKDQILLVVFTSTKDERQVAKLIVQ